MESELEQLARISDFFLPASDIRVELEAIVDRSYQDSKKDSEFATKSLEDQMRSVLEYVDEIGTAKDELQVKQSE